MIRNDDYFEIIKEQNKELAKFRPFKSAYEMKQEIERLNNIINELEKYIGIKMNSFGVCNASDIYYKLQKLKHKEIYGSVDSEILYYDELGSE